MKTSKKDDMKEKKFFALGTLNHIKIWGNFDEQLLNAAVQRVLEIEALLSAFINKSDVSRINQNAGKGFVSIQEETYAIIHRALEFSQISDGDFDITVRPLIECWGIGKKKNYIPKEEEIIRMKRLVDYRKLILDEKNCRAALTDEGQAIDLGGIAKGYAADEIKRIFIENNVESALINLGGNILTIGCQHDGRPWKIGIQNPIAPTGTYMGVLSAIDKTIVTSGSNERFFIKDVIRYHHILDSRTGMPAQSKILSVTAICGCSVDADALTTSFFVLGPERGMELAEKRKAEVIYVTENLDVIASVGIKDKFKLINNEMEN